MGKKQEKTVQAIRSRIVGHSEEDPADLLANPLNFRRHPGRQLEALRGSIKALGWLKGVIVNRTTGHVIDGHARCEDAMRQGHKVPVDWVELTEDEERLALAVLDPITEMATRDQAILADLLGQVSTADPGLQALLDSLAGKGPEGGEGAGGNEPPQDGYKEQFGVIVICTDAGHQERVFNELTAGGHNCRVVVT